MKEFIKKMWNPASFRHIKEHISPEQRGGEITRQTLSVLPFHEFSPNITNLMKSNYSKVSKGEL